MKSLWVIFWLFPLTCFAMTEAESLDYFCTTDEKHESLFYNRSAMNALGDVSQNVPNAGRIGAGYVDLPDTPDRISFAFQALDHLMDDPQRASLNYLWKLNLVQQYIMRLPTSEIPLDDIPIIFKVLKTNPFPLSASLEPLAQYLDKVIRDRLGCDADFLDDFRQGIDNGEQRVTTVTQWEAWFFASKASLAPAPTQ